MSNRLAIATVTATLQDRLIAAATGEIAGATVVVGRPDSKRQAEPAPAVNLFLYEVVNNPFLRNDHGPSRTYDGTLVELPEAALDLHYLLTFSGRESALEPHRLLGAAIAELALRPVLTADDIARSVERRDDLRGSDLASSPDRVMLTPLHLTIEELSRLWMMMGQEPYAISLQYRATPVVVSPTVERHVVTRVETEIIDVSPMPRRVP